MFLCIPVFLHTLTFSKRMKKNTADLRLLHIFMFLIYLLFTHHFTDPASRISPHDPSPDLQVSHYPHTGQSLSEVLPRT